MVERITLVGYRASGKTTVGRLLAERRGAAFVDADRELELRLGCAIADWFARRGEPAFRDEESASLGELLARDGAMVLATGGGVVERAGNRQALKQRGGLVVYLHADAATLQARLRADAGGRPSLTGRDIAAEVPAVLARREPWYREVATAVVAADEAPGMVAEHILDKLRSLR